MHIRVIAVGDRQPDWVQAAWDAYAARLPRQWRFSLKRLAGARRGAGSDARGAEGEAILSEIRQGERVIALDERGRDTSSTGLADWLSDWQTDGRDICLIVGGPDGLSAACLERADSTWSLSRLTLPHGLAQVLLVEQLYRAWTILSGHPYHRA